MDKEVVGPKVQGILLTVSALAKMHEEVKQLAPEIFNYSVLNNAINDVESYGAEIKAVWEFHKND